jgi:hypothetical protein
MADVPTSASRSLWSRFWTFLCELEEATGTTQTELLYRRVERLEEEVATLSRHVRDQRRFGASADGKEKDHPRRLSCVASRWHLGRRASQNDGSAR